MSVVIALRKKNGNFILASDSQATSEDFIYHNSVKIYKFEDSGIVIGGIGNLRNNCLLNCNPELFKPLVKNGKIDKKYLITDFTKELHAYLSEYYNHYGESENGKYTNGMIGYGNLIIAYKDEAYFMPHDFSVLEIEDYKAMGSGGTFAEGCIGTFLKYTDKDEEEIVTETIKMCSKKIDGIDSTIRIINTD